MKQFKLILSGVLVAGLVILGLYGCKKLAESPTKGSLTASDASGGSKSAKVYGQPGIASTASTLESIDITFTAGTLGAPAGFSLQWMTQAAYIANGNAWTIDTTTICKASFSGNASLSRYNLPSAGNTVTVRVGDLLFDNGASTNCAGDLVCGTTYVFRAFSHGGSVENKSAWSATLTASTLPCPTTNACVHGGQGYWRHLDISLWPQSVQNAGGLTLGTNFYTNVQLQAILTYPSGGNGLITVAHQLIPALLNQASGATYNPTGLATAQTYIGSLWIPPTNGSTSSKPASSAAGITGGINASDHTCTDTAN